MNQAEATGGAGDPAGKVTTCLLINPLSCRTLYGSLARRAELLAREHGLQVEVLGDPPLILKLLDELRSRQLARLFVLSGDGTIQLIARYLAELPAGDWNPELLLLGGGRANVVPRAFGGTPALRALRRVLRAVREQRPLRVELQPVLCVSQPGRPVQRGFILVGALIDFGVRYCRDWRAAGTSWWHRGILADQISLLRLAARTLAGRPLPAAPQLIVRMQPVGTLYAPVRVLVAGSLHDAGGHYNPYAARGQGPLRLTAVAAEAPRFWRNLPRMLTGRFDDQTMDVQQGYLSGHCHSATIEGLAAYSLDGEPFDADPSLPLQISTGHVLKVLRA